MKKGNHDGIMVIDGIRIIMILEKKKLIKNKKINK